MTLRRYDDRLLAEGDEIVTEIQFFEDEGSVTLPLGRLEEILFLAGYVKVKGGK